MTKKRSFGVKVTAPKKKEFKEVDPYAIRAYNLVVARMDVHRKEVLSIVKEIEDENERNKQTEMGI